MLSLNCSELYCVNVGKGDKFRRPSWVNLLFLNHTLLWHFTNSNHACCGLEWIYWMLFWYSHNVPIGPANIIYWPNLLVKFYGTSWMPSACGAKLEAWPGLSVLISDPHSSVIGVVIINRCQWNTLVLFMLLTCNVAVFCGFSEVPGSVKSVRSPGWNMSLPSFRKTRTSGELDNIF